MKQISVRALLVRDLAYVVFGLQREQLKVEQKIAEIRLREKLDARDVLVSSGLILVE